MFGGSQPILVLSNLYIKYSINKFFHKINILGQNTKRESGRKVQLENVNAGKVGVGCSNCNRIVLINDLDLIF